MPRIIMDRDEADFSFADAIAAAGVLDKAFDPSEPRDEQGQWTDGGGSEGGDGDSSGGGAGVQSEASTAKYAKDTKSDHPGISSDFDLRPGSPMPRQTGIVTADVGYSKSQPSYEAIPVSINPTVSEIKKISQENTSRLEGDAVRVLQDRSGNLFAWPSGAALHNDMMESLEPVETMWASDLWRVEKGKLVSDYGTADDKKVKDWLAKSDANAKTADTTTVGFVSPNVRTDLSFDGAVAQLTSDQQTSLLTASAAIDRGLGIRAKESNTIGAWADGAENSVMMTAGSDWDHGATAMAMKGFLADQKSVLVFQQQKGGKTALSSFRADGKLEDIHKALLEDGLAFHTLVPTADGATVYVADLDGTLADAVEKGAARYDSKVTFQFGKAQFIGDTPEFVGDKAGTGSEREQRDRARSVYEKVINESKISGSATVWSDVRNRWGAATEVKGVRRIYVRSSLVEVHRLISQIEAAGDIEIIPYDGEHIPGTELIDIREWDESQHPREPAGSSEGGQFAGGGGGDRGEGSDWERERAKGDPTSADALNKTEDHNVDHLIKSVSGAEEKVKEARAQLDKGIPTDVSVSKGGFRDENGNWLKSREAMHDQIIRSMFTPEAIHAATPAPGERPTIHFLGGRGGAGKSWFTKEGGKVDLAKNFLLNNDEIKKELPEYKGWNAALLHEESSEVGNRLEDLARSARLNIVLDGTMRSPGSLQRRVDEYRKAGYRIEGHYMFASPHTAAQRALQRFVDGGANGRFVPPEYSLNSTTNEKSFDSVRDKMDHWEVYDNNAPDFDPKLHSEGGTDFYQQTAAGVTGYSPGIKATNDNAKVKDAKEAWFKASPIKDLRQLVREAPSAQAELARVGNAVAAKVGVEFKNPGAKTKSASGVARARQKIAARKGDPSRITDVARGTFVINRPEQSDQLVAELAKNFEVTLEDWKLTDSNYFDRTINLRLPNGMVAEIQMMDPSMALAKSSPDHGGGGGHDIYKDWRNIDPHKSEADYDKYVDLAGKMDKLYGKVISDYPPIWSNEVNRVASEFAVLNFKPQT